MKAFLPLSASKMRTLLVYLTILISPLIASAEEEIDYYTCSMHPQVKAFEPDDRCPICGMELVPVFKQIQTSGSQSRELRMSPEAMALADIQTTSVKRFHPTKEVFLFGNISLDETQIADITAYFPGRIERLFVNYEGIKVNKGDHLAEIYSPDLITAQQELIAAKQALKHAGSSSSYTRKSSLNNLAATRDKLRLWGLSEKQIRTIENSKKPLEKLTIYSPQNGIVLKQSVQEGNYVRTGDRIYRVASLDRLWITLEAYETQLPWLRYGQGVEFSTDARPGQIYKGQISFISPTIDPIKRTTAIRVNISNSDQQLKPGMFVRAEVKAKISGSDQLIENTFQNKYICPMHPEVTSDSHGSCHICGMDLVTAESLGYVNHTTGDAPLMIPASSALITGKRAIVFVKDQDAAEPTFISREIKLGPRAGDFYVVKSGLSERELVVTKGAFKIDSAMQIMAKPSMMAPDKKQSPPPMMHDHQHHH